MSRDRRILSRRARYARTTPWLTPLGFGQIRQPPLQRRFTGEIGIPPDSYVERVPACYRERFQLPRENKMTTFGLLIFDEAEELDFRGPWEVVTASSMIRDFSD